MDKRATPDRFYLPELDGLRFLAFLAVFLSHVATFTYDTHPRPETIELFNMFGRFGIDLFFAVSAYLLTALVIREKERNGTLDIGRFYMRRILRIWPLYFTWLAILILTRSWWSDYSISFFIPYLGFIANVQPFYGIVASIVILPLWSLSVEEQFYVFFPIVF